MTTWRTRASAALCCAATALPGLLAAQAVPAQAQLYQLASDAVDARALWVNPAGLARRAEASFGAFATAAVDDGVEAAQWGLQVASRGVAFGWQHDDFGATSGNLYVLGGALGDERLSLGGSRRWYRRASRNGSSWDLALRAAGAGGLDAAVVWRDIGSPAAGDSVLEETLVAGAGLTLLGRVRVSGEWQGATSGFVGRTTRVGLQLFPGGGVALSAVADFSDNPRGRSVAIALSLIRPGFRFGAIGRDAEAGAGQAGVSVMSVSPAPVRRPGRRR